MEGGGGGGGSPLATRIVAPPLVNDLYEITRTRGFQREERVLSTFLSATPDKWISSSYEVLCAIWVTIPSGVQSQPHLCSLMDHFMLWCCRSSSKPSSSGNRTNSRSFVVFLFLSMSGTSVLHPSKGCSPEVQAMGGMVIQDGLFWSLQLAIV